ncbi:flavin-containing monooxygenase [Microbacterium sp. No. 7]|uniref:flavin-containing monooxygenase n=1 Tax=Microbacterium sp. No. 7 TaxID=1714373 RepID=UPI0006ECD8A2|nr:NAD(P)/FAD-dependent oxidoreductase [Microbacterium sp. No. 7]ALJ21911.1 hypothetical protein AOA12_19215 [Microbacterium sp. No. 7]
MPQAETHWTDTSPRSEVDDFAGRLREALASGHVPVLVALLSQLTGDPRWREERFRPTRTRGMDDHRDGGLPEDVQREIRDAAYELTLGWGPDSVVRPLGDDELTELATFAFGEEVFPEYGGFIQEILDARVGRDARPYFARRGPRVTTDKRVLIIGGGPSGLLSSIRLQAMGIDHVLLEKEPEFGGAWENNSYPGCGVDTPSFLYSYSFFDYAWRTHYGKRDEVRRYFIDVARANGVQEHTRFGTEVTDMVWVEDAGTWRVTARCAGEVVTYEAEIVLVGAGQLARPRLPDLPGMDTFEGVLTHSAEWPDDLDVTGKRVALIGAGASAMQIGPAIVDRVAELILVQRSKQWVAPCPNYFDAFDEAEHFLMAHVPLYLQWYRARLNWVYNDRVHESLQIDPDWTEPAESINAINAGHRRHYIRYIREKLAGHPDVIERSIPEYPPFGKRMLLDNGWYDMLIAPHTTFLSTGVAEVTPRGFIDTDGVEHECEVLVFATGFHVARFLHPMTVVGRDGRDTVQTWGEDDSRVYLGLTAPNFPNMFFLGGPATLLGHGGSFIGIAEMQVDYVMRLIAEMAERDLKSIACREDVCEDYNRALDEAHGRMVWTHRGMQNWYRNPQGRVLAVIPWRIADYRNMLRASDLGDYVVVPATAPATAIEGDAA